MRPSGISVPVSAVPSSSANSRRAVVSASSPTARSPLGMVQAPSSLLRQNGAAGMDQQHQQSTAFAFVKEDAGAFGGHSQGSPPGPASSALTDPVEERPSRRGPVRGRDRQAMNAGKVQRLRKSDRFRPAGVCF